MVSTSGTAIDEYANDEANKTVIAVNPTAENIEPAGNTNAIIENAEIIFEDNYYHQGMGAQFSEKINPSYTNPSIFNKYTILFDF